MLRSLLRVLPVLFLSGCTPDPAQSSTEKPLLESIDDFCSDATADGNRVCDCYVELADGRAARVWLIDREGQVHFRTVSRSVAGISPDVLPPDSTILRAAGPDDPLYRVLRERMQREGGL